MFANGGDEHGILRPADGHGDAVLPALGDTVRLIPGHCDPTVNLHDRLIGVRAGRVACVLPVDARGALR